MGTSGGGNKSSPKFGELLVFILLLVSLEMASSFYSINPIRR
ncbi:hypothetical protein HMPREF3187_00819 [Aerococcus christensenii]|uniref:Uncharacterized protein n=1 Tax=Aerococcus christensenii TaxID=87541 RepID=A0A133XZU7_9LACT|nr:hypothetical protein HMPREF3187_00819 [Aerococcus christensenii]